MLPKRLFVESLLFLPILLINGQNYTCPQEAGIYCNSTTQTVYLFDTSVHMIPADILSMFDFIRTQIYPGTAWNTLQETAVCSYGTGGVLQSLQNPVNQLIQACACLDILENSWKTIGSEDASLLVVLNAVNTYYPSSTNIIFFSASNDTDDIAKAAAYVNNTMKTKHFTVVAMNGANFSSFPADEIYTMQSFSSIPPNLVPCLLKNACNMDQTCNANSPPDPPIWTPTTPRTTTSTSSSVSEECPRNASTAWIDVIFLLESSLAAEQDSLLHMWAFAGTLLDNFNVQCANYTDSNYTTRVGVITYGDQAVVNYPLGSVDNAFLDTVLSLPYLAGKVSNLQAGIEAAIDQFAGPNSRPNARKVIVIMAVSYTPGGQYAPQQAANTFKKYGIIVVYNYLPSNLDPTPQLQELATPGYFYTSKNGTLDEMANALCDANCFCPKDWIVYMEGTYRQLPTEGCYQLYETTNSYRYVVLECVSAYNSIPAIADSEDKNAFLANMDYGSSFYIGLSWDKANKRWVWADGSELGSYQPWSNSSVIDGSGGFTNVYVSPSANWVSTNPAAAYYTICQSAPCNSMNYCPVIL